MLTSSNHDARTSKHEMRRPIGTRLASRSSTSQYLFLVAMLHSYQVSLRKHSGGKDLVCVFPKRQISHNVNLRGSWKKNYFVIKTARKMTATRSTTVIQNRERRNSYPLAHLCILFFLFFFFRFSDLCPPQAEQRTPEASPRRHQG